MRREAEITDPIRPGGELRDIAYRRHPVRAHIGTDVAPDVTAQPEDRAVAVERDLKLAFGLARMRNGHEMLAPVLDPFDWSAELARRKCNQKVLRIEFAAGAKAAADVVFDIVDRLLRQPHHRRHGAPVEEGELGSAGYGEPGAVPFGQEPARLQRHRGHPLYPELLAPGIGSVAEGG